MHDEELDLAGAAPPPNVRIASGVVMVAGLAAVLVGIQHLIGFEMLGLYFAVPLGLALLGAATIAAGWVHGKARTRAAVASLVLSAVLFVGSSVWVVLGVAAGGLVSMMSFGAVGLAGLAVVVVPFSIPACRRTSLAQARLRAAGLDLGL
jgi:hypothetical protein